MEAFEYFDSLIGSTVSLDSKSVICVPFQSLKIHHTSTRGGRAKFQSKALQSPKLEDSLQPESENKQNVNSVGSSFPRAPSKLKSLLGFGKNKNKKRRGKKQSKRKNDIQEKASKDAERKSIPRIPGSTGSFTISFWIYLPSRILEAQSNSWGQPVVLVSQGRVHTLDNSHCIQICLCPMTRRIRFGFRLEAGRWSWIYAQEPTPTNRWVLICCSYDAERSDTLDIPLENRSADKKQHPNGMTTQNSQQECASSTFGPISTSTVMASSTTTATSTSISSTTIAASTSKSTSEFDSGVASPNSVPPTLEISAPCSDAKSRSLGYMYLYINCILHEHGPTLTAVELTKAPIYIGGCSNREIDCCSCAKFLGFVAEARWYPLALLKGASVPEYHHELLSSLKEYFGRYRPRYPPPCPSIPPLSSLPFVSLEQLDNWKPGCDPLNRCAIPLDLSHFASRRKAFRQKQIIKNNSVDGKLDKVCFTMHCHDLQGGYHHDHAAQGTQGNAHTYNFTAWSSVDIFVYFSHHRITIPPVGWMHAAHTHGSLCLGTVITEWENGISDTMRMVDGPSIDSGSTSSDISNPFFYAKKLVQLAVYYGFDGWLINVESPLSSEATNAESFRRYVSKWVNFVENLTQQMHSAKPGSIVLWYDSIKASGPDAGQVSWQSELNSANSPFFEVCDGIFLDYHWDAEAPSRSASFVSSLYDSTTNNEDRRCDIFVGIDIWGRGTYGGGGFETHVALELIAESGLSAALFAPAWTFEKAASRTVYQIRENQLWNGIKWTNNLVSNLEASNATPTVEDFLNRWEVTQGGQGWSLTESPFSDGPSMCLITSHKWCTRTKLFDLWEMVNLETEDVKSFEFFETCPDIFFRQNICGTEPNLEDCYRLKVSLLTETKELLACFDTSEITCPQTGIQTIEYTFSDYSKGTCDRVRFVEWEEMGKDSEQWAGHYGVKIGHPYLAIKLPNSKSIQDYVYNSEEKDLQAIKGDSARESKSMTKARGTFLSHLPIQFSYNSGRGDSMFVDGTLASSTPWINLSLQDNHHIVCLSPRETHHNVKTTCVDNVSFNGGSSMQIQCPPTAQSISLHLFRFQACAKESKVHERVSCRLGSNFMVSLTYGVPQCKCVASDSVQASILVGFGPDSSLLSPIDLRFNNVSSKSRRLESTSEIAWFQTTMQFPFSLTEEDFEKSVSKLTSIGAKFTFPSDQFSSRCSLFQCLGKSNVVYIGQFNALSLINSPFEGKTLTRLPLPKVGIVELKAGVSWSPTCLTKLSLEHSNTRIILTWNLLEIDSQVDLVSQKLERRSVDNISQNLSGSFYLPVIPKMRDFDRSDQKDLVDSENEMGSTDYLDYLGFSYDIFLDEKWIGRSLKRMFIASIEADTSKKFALISVRLRTPWGWSWVNDSVVDVPFSRAELKVKWDW